MADMRGGSPLSWTLSGTDKQLERMGKAQDYAKKRSGVPVEELPQHGKWRWRSLISLLLLLAAFGLVLVGSYFLLR